MDKVGTQLGNVLDAADGCPANGAGNWFLGGSLNPACSVDSAFLIGCKQESLQRKADNSAKWWELISYVQVLLPMYATTSVLSRSPFRYNVAVICLLPSDFWLLFGGCRLRDVDTLFLFELGQPLAQISVFGKSSSFVANHG